LVAACGIDPGVAVLAAGSVVVAVETEAVGHRVAGLGRIPHICEIDLLAAEDTENIGFGKSAYEGGVVAPAVLGEREPSARVILLDPTLKARNQLHVAEIILLDPGAGVIGGIPERARRLELVGVVGGAAAVIVLIEAIEDAFAVTLPYFCICWTYH
jgi:hypothetical protein